METRKEKLMWWLSWADAEGFNGAVVIEGKSFEEALLRANLLNIRPAKGGQVIGFPVNGSLFDPKDLNRLLNKKEASKYV